MYRIISTTDGRELGAVDHVTYIKVGASGSYVFADQEDAVGVSLNGTPYNLVGHDEIQEEDTVAEAVIVSEFDGGALVAEQQRIIDSLLISALEG